MQHSSFEYKKWNHSDNIEMFSSVNETDYFPFHFHDYYCISLITGGTEQLDTLDESFYALTGSVSVTQANEVHKNRAIDSSGYSYKTLYVNPDLLKFYGTGKKPERLERVINDGILAGELSNLFGGKSTLANFQTVLKRLTRYATSEKPVVENRFELLDELCATFPYQSVSLDWLSKQFCMSKFHFVRVFKAAKGISPQAYMMLKRLKIAKEMLLNNQDPRHVAFMTGFYDAAHLNTAFKRFFGITLSMIKKSS
ncbi:AraC family transcriptional regulator [Pedobacter antarcticus]|uniref:AraC family transcriptional regulator n=1 Tax=Pedobacter antarcticus TaxID=34086 RepID=UPI00292D391A|nr:AraC family transcriptional regulator [Pedobacter antarcticus]